MLSGLYLYLCGFCMGAADLVPGISGGTIAFILGFYPSLIKALKSFNLEAFKLLFTGQWRAFLQKTEWRFLATLISGIVTAFAVLSGSIHFVLEHETYRSYLYAAFLGLILASFFLCIRQVKKWCPKMVLGLAVGALSAFLLTTAVPEVNGEIPDSGWIMFSGALAICAMLLPGISGSYVLSLMGVYPLFIGSLANLFGHLKFGIIDWDAAAILLYLGVGIVVGVLLFSRFLSWLLRTHPDLSLAVLCGFMIGGLRTVWPDWNSVEAVQLALWMAVGFSCVFGIEFVAKGTSRT